MRMLVVCGQDRVRTAPASPGRCGMAWSHTSHRTTGRCRTVTGKVRRLRRSAESATAPFCRVLELSACGDSLFGPMLATPSRGHREGAARAGSRYVAELLGVHPDRAANNRALTHRAAPRVPDARNRDERRSPRRAGSNTPDNAAGSQVGPVHAPE